MQLLENALDATRRKQKTGAEGETKRRGRNESDVKRNVTKEREGDWGDKNKAMKEYNNKVKEGTAGTRGNKRIRKREKRRIQREAKPREKTGEKERKPDSKENEDETKERTAKRGHQTKRNGKLKGNKTRGRLKNMKRDQRKKTLDADPRPSLPGLPLLQSTSFIPKRTQGQPECVSGHVRRTAPRVVGGQDT